MMSSVLAIFPQELTEVTNIFEKVKEIMHTHTHTHTKQMGRKPQGGAGGQFYYLNVHYLNRNKGISVQIINECGVPVVA